MGRRRIATFLAVLAMLVPASARTDTVVSFDSESPAAIASKISAVDLTRLGVELAGSGLVMPQRVDVALIANSDQRARNVPPWIVGLALEPTQIVVFYERVLPYPYDSLESVFRHEVAHLALSARADERPLPRWFHEGVAMSVDQGWDTTGRLRLLVEMTGNPATADLARLFASESQPDTAQAYGLSAALIADIERRHGKAAPARIASRVATGIPFSTAFVQETGETPDEAADRAWRAYRRWTMWISAITSDAAIWGVIVTLAIVGSIVQARRRALRRAQWDEMESSTPDGGSESA